MSNLIMDTIDTDNIWKNFDYLVSKLKVYLVEIRSVLLEASKWRQYYACVEMLSNTAERNRQRRHELRASNLENDYRMERVE